MSIFEIASILAALAAVFGYINYRYIRLPMAIGVMGVALAAALVISAVGAAWPPLRSQVAKILAGIDFGQALMHGMLAFLLFAGAMQVKLSDLAREWDVVALLASVGTVVSMFIVAGLVWMLFQALHIEATKIQCLLYGALISPTDPIAVLGVMNRQKTSKSLETQISGEALFNDGVGVVLFLVLLDIASGQAPVRPSAVALLLLKEVAGGVAIGIALGWIAYLMLKRVDHYQIEVPMTVALAMGVYSLADALHVSAPISVVAAGLVIGNPGRAFAMSEQTRRYVDGFWELVDEMLNGVLFLLIGMEVLVLPFTARHILAALLCIPIPLAARYLSVAGVVGGMRRWRKFEPGAIRILTWGGLRGGISVAMALSLPEHTHHNLLLVVTYFAVVFGIFVQGLTMGKLIQRVGPAV
jgi:CPA1 family monovalent cation:H+ antiporter